MIKKPNRIIQATLIVVVFLALFFSLNNISNENPEETEFLFENQVFTPVSPTVVAPTLAVPPATQQSQQEGKIYISYKYTDVIPRELFDGTDITNETLYFQKSEGVWPAEAATPRFRNLGPLFLKDGEFHIYEFLSHASGYCPINTHVNTNGFLDLSFQPLCKNFESKEMVYMTFGLSYCDRDRNDDIVCSKSTGDTNTSVIIYKLSKGLDKFDFTYAGSWHKVYEIWIKQALIALEFQEVPSDFFDNIQPGIYYSLNK